MAPRKGLTTTPQPPTEEVENPATTAVTPATKVLIRYKNAVRDLQLTVDELSQVVIEGVSESTTKVHIRRLTHENERFRSALEEYQAFFPNEEPDDGLRLAARDLLFRLEEHAESFSATRPASVIQPLPQHPTSICKLPKLELLTFTGKLEEWGLFWDSFLSSVHDRGDLTDDVKLRYLTSVLRDEARKVLGRVAKKTVFF